MTNNPLALVILAAGKGTRMKSDLPKVLHPLLGRPMLDHVLNTAKGLRPLKNIVVVGHQAQRVREAFPDFSGIFILQSPQLGTGHALQTVAKELISFKGVILVLSGDVPLIEKETLKQLITRFRKDKAVLALISTDVKNPYGYGRIIRDTRGKLLRIVEEKDATHKERAIQEINTGLYCFDSEFLFSALSKLTPQNRQKEYYLTDLVRIAGEMGLPMAAMIHPNPEEVLGVNDRAELARSNYVLRQRINKDWMQRGVTLLDPTSIYIEPSVRIGSDTVISPFTMLLGRTRIGSHCLIQSHTVIEEAILKDGVSIPPFSFIKKQVVRDKGSKGPGVQAEKDRSFTRTLETL
jgi:bifunctional UDP-N-acetylglucosamine pyrophosphorylase / glucosamine-1-phosphate N-acetyltransferase